MTKTPALSDRQLAAELKKRGLAVLGVVRGSGRPGHLTVYLHGHAGQYAHGYARELISRIPGVTSATDSDISPTIVLVRVAMVRGIDERA